jgi:hypothetical protein
VWIYVIFTGSATTLVLASIAAVHCGIEPAPVDGPQISARGDNPQELRRCQRDLARLLSDLHHETFQLQRTALKYDIDPATEWHAWSRGWRYRWRALDRRCRLSELESSQDSPAIGKMYRIHSAMAELQLSYTGVMDRFVEKYVQRLRNLRRELGAVRDMIDRQPPRARGSAVERTRL